MWGNKKVKEILYPVWEGSMNALSGFWEEQMDDAEGRGVAEGETYKVESGQGPATRSYYC